MNQEELQIEYSKFCVKSGDLAYKILCYQAELEGLHNEMRDINRKAAEIKKEEEKANETI